MKHIETLKNRKWIINLKGKDFITFSGLLWLAHQMNLTSLISTCIYEDWDKGIFVFRAEAIGLGKDEGLIKFVDEGEAAPYNVGTMIKPHIRRMASTSAMARALRLYTGMGMTALEEIQ